MEKSIYSKKEVNNFIKQLEKKEIGFFDIPEYLRTNKSIVDIERRIGLRKADKRGYDVISGFFFVEEIITYTSSLGEQVTKNIRTNFLDFDSYYLFLNGDIYENACYYQFDFSAIKAKIDTKKISNKAFENTTIDDYTLKPSKEEIENYNQAEYTKMICKKWVRKFNTCNTYTELVKNIEDYKKSEISDIVNISFFLFQYIFENIYDKNRFNIIMEYVSNGEYQAYRIIKSLCLIYNSDDVVAAYNYSMGTNQTKYRHKKKLKDYVKLLNSGDMTLSKYCYFDPKTHYYCEESFNSLARVCRYFETFESFVMYRQGDLTNCDISNVVGLNLDVSKYKTDSTTKLPFVSSDELTYVEEKVYENGKFIVRQIWYDSDKNIIKKYNHTFCYFFDFVAFLKGNLSNADLLFCDGLKHLKDITKLNLSGARLTSWISKRFGIEYDNYDIDKIPIQSFVPTIKNEKETMLTLQTDREQALSLKEYMKNQKVYYISDLHLMHKIEHAKCESKNDIVYVVSNVVKNITQEISSNLLLIGGDTASNFTIFELFVKILRKALDEKSFEIDVIFLLGNHELWEFSDKRLTDIINKYDLLLQKYNMYLLQNDILYEDKDNCLKRITTEELLSYDKSVIRMKLCTSRIVIFGGLAFSGYNEEFNANKGLYWCTIDRKTEIEETQKFEKIYNVVCETLSDKNLIIFTHTPKEDWCKNLEQQKHFVYVSGHTHHNYFFDDGEYRTYADNQIGYHNENPHMKYFYIENEYDCFSDYEDGIYEISEDQYKNFYRGKNIPLNFNREVNILYMLIGNCETHDARSQP